MTTDWTVLGGNPAPGEMPAIEALLGSSNQIVESVAPLRQQIQALLAILSQNSWGGESADRFRTVLEASATHLSAVVTAHDGLSGALQIHVGSLPDLQAMAEQALAEATQATATINSDTAQSEEVRGKLNAATSTFDSAVTELGRIAASIDQRVKQLSDAVLQLFSDAEHALASTGDEVLRSFVGEQTNWTGVKNDAENAIHTCTTLLADLGISLDNARAALRQAQALADQTSTEFASLVNGTRSRIEANAEYDLTAWTFVATQFTHAARSNVDRFDGRVFRDAKDDEIVYLEHLASSSKDVSAFISSLPGWVSPVFSVIGAAAAAVIIAVGAGDPAADALADVVDKVVGNLPDLAATLMASTALAADLALAYQGAGAVSQAKLESDAQALGTDLEKDAVDAGLSEIPGVSGDVASDITEIPAVSDAITHIENEVSSATAQHAMGVD